MFLSTKGPTSYQTMISFMHRVGEFREALGIWHSRPASVKATFEKYRCVILSCLRVNESAAQVEPLFLDAINMPRGIRRTLSLLNEMISLGFLVRFEFFCAVLEALHESHNALNMRNNWAVPVEYCFKSKLK